jgi:hypothetical protein
MKRSLLLFFIFFLLSSRLIAQRDLDDDSWSIKNRGFVGLGLTGLSLGNSPSYGKYFTIGVSGQVGYMLTKYLSSGVGVDFEYTSYSDQKLKLYSTGTYPFLRYNIKQFFIQTEYAFYTLKAKSPIAEEKVNAERCFIGLGYCPETSSRGKFNLLLSYDVLYENSGLFPSPLSIRVFYTFH